jgi:hypothetical protein
MEMEIARLVLDFLKVLPSPQVVTGAVIVFFLVFFNLPVVQLINRIKSLKGPAGTGAEFGEQLRTAEEVKPQLAKTHGMVAGEQLTLGDVAHGSTIATPTPASAQQANALQAAQTLARWWVFEKVYRGIFKSQIELLRHLQHKADHRASWSELQVFYQQGILAQGVTPLGYPYQGPRAQLAPPARASTKSCGAPSSAVRRPSDYRKGCTSASLVRRPGPVTNAIALGQQLADALLAARVLIHRTPTDLTIMVADTHSARASDPGRLGGARR